MATQYKKTFTCSDTFPTWVGDEWVVTERGKAVERWHVTAKSSKSFTVVITKLGSSK